MALANYLYKIAIMKETGLIIKSKALVKKLIPMEHSILVSSIRIKNMVKVKLFGLMGIDIVVVFSMERWKAKECIFGKMGRNMKEI